VAVISEPPMFNFVPPPIPTGAFGVVQTGVRVKVSLVDSGTVFWDSGELATSTTSVMYAGPALMPFSMYQWVVTVTLSTGQT
jgi:hypothetical protein